MSSEVQDSVVAFARENLDKFGLDGLDVVWFGGEPLLFPGIIESLSERLISVCDEFDADYHARIITNGWLLTEENARLLERAKVDFIQTTLDGPTPETNDHLRRSKEGGSSFQRIMENLRQMRPFETEPPNRVPGTGPLERADDQRTAQDKSLARTAAAVEQTELRPRTEHFQRPALGRTVMELTH